MIITYEQFKEINNKDRKREVLEDLMKHYPDKAIREHWGIRPQNFYNLVSQLKLSGENRPTGEYPEEISTPQRKNNKNVIDADFVVYENSPTPQQADPSAGPAQLAGSRAIVPAMPQQTAGALLNFPDMVGNTAQLRKLMEGMLMILEATNGNDTPFKLRIEVYKA